MENTSRNITVVLFALFYIAIIIFFGRNCFIRPGACSAMYKEYLVGVFVVSVLLIEQLVLIPKLYFRNRFRWFWLLSAVLILLLTAGEMILVFPNIQRSLQYFSRPASDMVMTFSLLVLFRNLGLYSFVFFITVLLRELSLARKKALALKAQIQYMDVRNFKNEIVYADRRGPIHEVNWEEICLHREPHSPKETSYRRASLSNEEIYQWMR